MTSYNPTGREVKIYLDGSLDKTYTLAQDMNFPAKARIGRDGYGDNPWKGALDEGGVWSRVLSADNVAALFNGGDGLEHGGATAKLGASALKLASIAYGDATALSGFSGGDVSVSTAAWVWPTSSDGYRSVIGLGGNGVREHFYQRIESSGKLAIGADDGSSDLWTVGEQNIPLNAWSHVATTYDAASKTVSIYVNGALDKAVTLSAGLALGTGLRVGHDAYGDSPFDGLIDEVGVWARALSAGEVATLFNGGDGLAHGATADAHGLFVVDAAGDEFKVSLSPTVPGTGGAAGQTSVAAAGGALSLTVLDDTPAAAAAGQVLLYYKKEQADDPDFTAGSDLAQGLIAYWAFEGSFEDGVGPNHGTPQGHAAIVSAGKIGQCATFSNDDSYITMPEPIIDPGTGNDGPKADDALTLAIWAFPTACGNRGLLSYGGTGNRAHFYQRLEGSCKLTLSGDHGVHDAWTTTSAAIQQNVWTHVVTSYDGAAGNTAKIYFNAVLQKQFTLPTDMLWQAKARIGRDEYNDNPFKGNLDEAAVWKRALTDAEVAQLYNGGKGQTYGKGGGGLFLLDSEGQKRKITTNLIPA